MALVDVKLCVSLVTQVNIVVMFLTDELIWNLPQVNWNFVVTGIGSDHRMSAKDGLDVSHYSLLLVFVT